MPASQFSISSIFLLLSFDTKILSNATGFIVERNNKKFLITNWHVLSGRRPDTGQPIDTKNGAVPNRLTLHYLKKRKDKESFEWIPIDEQILDENQNPLWLEHPTYGRTVDVVALELKNHSEYQLFPYTLESDGIQVRVDVSDRLNIIGFPFGLTAGGMFGIWLNGFVASEPDVNFNNLPIFLIDARTREGQSGSPVISYTNQGMVKTSDGGGLVYGEVMNLLGIYSGRINDESDIGIVWKKNVIVDIIDGITKGNTKLPAGS